RRFITLRITARTDLADGELETRVSIRNSGNDDARNVRVGVDFGGRATRSDTIAALDHDAEREVVLTVPGARLADGEWPLRVRVDYQDTNGYPFQALHVGTVRVGSCRPPEVGVSEVGIVRLESNGSASLSFCVGNAGEQPRTVSTRIDVSDDLGRAAAPEPMQLRPYGRECTTVRLRNHHALPGSTYPVFVVAEYVAGAPHRTVVGSGPGYVVEPLRAAGIPRLLHGRRTMRAPLPYPEVDFWRPSV